MSYSLPKLRKLCWLTVPSYIWLTTSVAPSLAAIKLSEAYEGGFLLSAGVFALVFYGVTVSVSTPLWGLASKRWLTKKYGPKTVAYVFQWLERDVPEGEEDEIDIEAVAEKLGELNYQD